MPLKDPISETEVGSTLEQCIFRYHRMKNKHIMKIVNIWLPILVKTEYKFLQVDDLLFPLIYLR